MWFEKTDAGQKRSVFYAVYAVPLVVGLITALALRHVAALVVVGAVLGAVVWAVAALAGAFHDLEGGATVGALFVAMLVCSWSLGVVAGGLIRRLSHGQQAQGVARRGRSLRWD